MKLKPELTEKQRKVLRFIFNRIRSTNLPPTIREIAAEFGFSSTGTVRDHLNALVKKGFLRIEANKSRAIELVKEALFRIPILGKVQAGLPSLAVEDIEGYLDIESLVFSDENIFALRVRGDSMIDAGIMPNDLVLVKKQAAAQVGDTVVALFGEEATVKKLSRKNDKIYLEPANERYEPMALTPQTTIIGKVISVVRRLR